MKKLIKISNPILYGFGFIINDKRFSLCVVPGTLDRYGKDATIISLFEDIVLNQVQKNYPHINYLKDSYYDLIPFSERKNRHYEITYCITDDLITKLNHKITELLESVKQYTDRIIVELDKEFAEQEKKNNFLNSLPDSL